MQTCGPCRLTRKCFSCGRLGQEWWNCPLGIPPGKLKSKRGGERCAYVAGRSLCFCYPTRRCRFRQTFMFDGSGIMFHYCFNPVQNPSVTLMPAPNSGVSSRLSRPTRIPGPKMRFSLTSYCAANSRIFDSFFPNSSLLLKI